MTENINHPAPLPGQYRADMADMPDRTDMVRLEERFAKIEELPVTEEMLGAYLEGRLDPLEAHEVEALIASDPTLGFIDPDFIDDGIEISELSELSELSDLSEPSEISEISELSEPSELSDFSEPSEIPDFPDFPDY